MAAKQSIAEQRAFLPVYKVREALLAWQYAGRDCGAGLADGAKGAALEVGADAAAAVAGSLSNVLLAAARPVLAPPAGRRARRAPVEATTRAAVAALAWAPSPAC